ncbi:ATP-binding protein [Kitasatospora sp. NBC_01246]|uniref:ATP-binding protein n=1 Tax=Kitasatospora sp. NBC_01246 TaxID=2903570 RepID=UPI002E30C48D|nr:ATP-binding protein [Kitasatospora sp. NBC_01246]
MGDALVRATGWARSFPIAGGVRAGRRWTRNHLRSLAWTRDAPETVDAVLLTVSELLTNAHIHAHSSAELVLVWDGRCLHVSVHDGSTAVPEPRSAGTDALNGRGMAIVDALADEWEIRRQQEGKTVIACFHPPGERDPHPRDTAGRLCGPA